MTIITFISVGYGDSFPLTTMGKFVGAITAILGVGLHALLIGIVGAAFVAITKNEKEMSE